MGRSYQARKQPYNTDSSRPKHQDCRHRQRYRNRIAPQCRNYHRPAPRSPRGRFSMPKRPLKRPIGANQHSPRTEDQPKPTGQPQSGAGARPFLPKAPCRTMTSARKPAFQPSFQPACKPTCFPDRHSSPTSPQKLRIFFSFSPITTDERKAKAGSPIHRRRSN